MIKLSEKIPLGTSISPKEFLKQLNKHDPHLVSTLEYYKHFVPSLKRLLEGNGQLNAKILKKLI